jgi:hypothetical protein
MVRPGSTVRDTQPPIGQTTFYPRVPIRESAVVFGRGSTLVIRDRDTSAGARAAEAGTNERRYEVAVIDAVRRYFAGRSVTVREVYDAVRLRVVRLRAEDLQTAYSVRDILLILCAMGLATVELVSAEPCFTIRPLSEA